MDIKKLEDFKKLVLKSMNFHASELRSTMKFPKQCLHYGVLARDIRHWSAGRGPTLRRSQQMLKKHGVYLHSQQKR